MDLSQETLSALSADDKQELEIWTELLESRGFDLLVRFLQGNYDSNTQVIENAASWDGYVYARGARDALGLVLNLEQIIEARLKEAAEYSLQEATEDDEDTFDEISVNLGLE